jgi:hypothetical protein
MKFIHYGCWNNIDCSKAYSYRDIIIDYIKSYETDYDYVIISGDNWYSNEKDEVKQYYTNVLRSGLIKLYGLNKPIHIVLGNHDEATNDNVDEVNELQKDCMLKTEKYYIKHIHDESLLPTLEYLYTQDLTIQEESRLKLYEAESQPGEWYDEVNKILHIFLNTNIFTDTHKQIDVIKYINHIPNIVRKYPVPNHLFITGHVPITSKFHKVKKDKIVEYTSLSNNMSIMKHILDVFISLNPIPIYLCADTHNFQIMSIRHGNKYITQIVVGTGGAEPDDLKAYIINNRIQYVYNITPDSSYYIEGFYNNSYGYTTLEINDNLVKVVYKHILGIDDRIVNQAYEYLIKDNGQIDALPQSKLSPDISELMKQMSNSKYIKEGICANLHTDNLVKSANNPDIFCYKKIKNK